MKTHLKNRQHSFLFGPVPSRRLGMSLGVDLVPYKTCSMDCVYCESGPTIDHTVVRKEFYPSEEIIRELDAYLSTGPELDYITFSGAGEPTLHSGIGNIIRFIKEKYPSYKICLLTNGMLLSDKQTFEDVKNVDLIVPSLDAVTSDICEKINRPVGRVDCGMMIEAFARFHRESGAKFYLEIFIIHGVNDTPEALKGFSDAIAIINPDKVQLNSIDRPGTEAWVAKMTKEQMENIRDTLSIVAEVEIIGKFEKDDSLKAEAAEAQYENLDAKILDLIFRRPCTVNDLQASLGYPENSVEKILKRMTAKKLITSEKRERGVFYLPLRQ